MNNTISVDDFKMYVKQKKYLMDSEDLTFIKNYYDKYIEDFCDKILPRYASGETNQIDKGKAINYLSIYVNGSEVRKSYEYFSKLVFDEKAMKEIIEILHKPLAELRTYGQIAVQLYYFQFRTYVMKWWNDQRYKKIYKSESFVKWLKKIEEYPEIDNARAMLEFNDFQQIDRKVQLIINTSINF
jgi:hypothetical protein